MGNRRCVNGYKYFTDLFFATLLAIALVKGVRQISHGALSKIEVALMVVCYLALLILILNNRGNRILDESMMGLAWTAMAVGQWVQDRHFLPVIGWAVLAIWSFWFSYTAWKNPKRYAKFYDESASRLGKSYS
jgi:hypothetical protein